MAVRDQTCVERMVLDDQERVARCAMGERVQHDRNRLADPVERRVDNDLGIAVQLQREHVVRALVVEQVARDLLRFVLVQALLDGSIGQARIFLEAVFGAVAFVMRETVLMHGVRHAVGDVVISAFVDVVAGGLAGRHGGDVLALVQIEGRIGRQQGTAVDAVALHRDPVRTNVALFEDVYAQAERLGHGMHGTMDGAAVAEQKNVGEIAGLG